MDKQPAVYIMSNQAGGTLYTGVTSRLLQHVYEHRTAVTGFTARYRCHRLVYFALFDRMDVAIAEEKRIKAGSRAGKIALIEALNPSWRDLAEDFTL